MICRERKLWNFPLKRWSRSLSKIAYFDCPTGIAGDMCLGALTHAGVPLTYLREQLAKLGIKQEYSLSIESVQRNQQAATKFHVQLADAGSSPSQSNQAQDDSDAAEHHHHHTAFHEAAHAAARAEGMARQTGDGIAHPHSEAHSHSRSGTQSHNHSHSHSHSHSETFHNRSEVQSHSNGHSHSHSETAHSHSSSRPEANAPAVHHHSHQRNLPEIERLIRQAQLPARAEAWSLAVFRNLAIAEATVHGTTIEEVHFHEVGAVDAIVDIVGTCLGLDYLDIDEIYCSALPTGGGTVWAAHGRLPVPAPAVLKLFSMGQVPVYGNGIERELVTPTGAAIAITLAQSFGPPPPMRLQTIGLGAGTIDLPIPNMVRLWIGESDAQVQKRKAKQQNPAVTASAVLSAQPQVQQIERDATPDNITLLQTQLDDLSPQAIGYAFEQLLEAGALDVFTQAIAMKKNRPGILLSVICPDNKIADCESILFKETSTLGIRRQPQQRSILQRYWQTVTTDYGPVRIKVAGSSEHGESVNVQPEYEDCAAIARAQNLPWREVHQLALQAWHQSQQ